MRILLTFLSCLWAAVLTPAPAVAQSVDVTVHGTVTDATRSVLPGATVTLRNRATGLIRAASTQHDGRYQLPPVPAGVYDMKVELAGFRPRELSALTLHVGTTIAMDVLLDEVALSEATEVVSRAPALETTRSTLSRIVAKEEIDTLPVANRNFNALASLVPGVTPTGRYGGVDINGSRDFQNGYNVDGVSAEGLGAGDQRIAYAQDWIQEFQVLTSQYNVEFGRASGGIMNAITRSGSNVTTGRAYAFLRNDAWDATPRFTREKAPLDTKRAGATAGGRVIPDQLFFFGGYEWYDNQSSTVVNSSFADRNGNVPITARQNLYIGKLEHHPDHATTYRIRYNGDRRRNGNVGVGGRATEEQGLSVRYAATEVAGAWNRVIGSSAFNELRVAYTDTSDDSRCNVAERTPPGSWFTLQYPGALLGCVGTGFGIRNSRELQMIQNLSVSTSSHELKLGAQLSRGRSDGDFRFIRDGIYRFQRDVPFDIANPASYPASFSLFEGGTAWDYSRWSWGLFVQDSWRLAPGATMNVGVRYDVDGSYTALNPLIRTDRGLHTVRADRDNIAPRAGVAWAPFGDGRRTLLRGGVGVYYDENHLDVGRLLLFNSVLVERSVTLNAFNPGLNPYWPDSDRAQRVLAEALARNTVPDVSLLPGTVSVSPDLDPNLQVPFALHSGVGVSHEFVGRVTTSADVVFAHGHDQYVNRDVNLDRDAALLQNRIVRLNPNYSGINQYGNGGRFAYRALQLHASFLPSTDHLVRFSYTWSRSESNTRTALEGAGGTGAFAASNPFDLDEDHGPADQDIRHNLTANWLTTLPYGFQLSGTLGARSALPWSVTTAVPLDADPFPDRPEPRNSRRGDEYFSIDARLAKVIRFAARRSLTAFAEVFNATNASNLIGYVAMEGGAQFGQATAALESRHLQVGFRVDF